MIIAAGMGLVPHSTTEQHWILLSWARTINMHIHTRTPHTWGMMEILLRRSCSPKLRHSLHQSWCPPGSASLNKVAIRDDLPAPVRPTIPIWTQPHSVKSAQTSRVLLTFSEGSMVAVIPFSTWGPSGRVMVGHITQFNVSFVGPVRRRSVWVRMGLERASGSSLPSAYYLSTDTIYSADKTWLWQQPNTSLTISTSALSERTATYQKVIQCMLLLDQAMQHHQILKKSWYLVIISSHIHELVDKWDSCWKITIATNMYT